MRNINTIFFSLILVFSSIFLIACSDKNTKNTDYKSDNKIQKEQNQNKSEQNIDKKKLYLEHLNQVREKLKKELGDQYYKPSVPATKAQIELGKKIYLDRCAKCHGEQGKGDGPLAEGLTYLPANFTDTTRMAYYSDEGHKQIIRKGIIGTVMFAWEEKLTEKEIDAVYAYIKNFTQTK